MTSARLRVAIDAHTIGRRATGNETYVHGLLSGLLERHDVEPIALIDGGGSHPNWLDGHTAELRNRKAIPRLAIEMAFARRRWGAEVLHVQYVRPPICDAACVTTIHDISFEHFPALFARRSRARMRLTIPWSARHSRMVLTGSLHARDDLIATYELAPERVAVTPYAADPRFRRVPAAEVTRLLARFDLPSGYLLCVGNLQPRKNLRRLLGAYAGLPPGIRPPLVVVGQATWQSEDVHAAVREHRVSDSVKFIGFVETDELVALYNGAAAFAYPSLFEGFGLPVLEALACGVPTLTSGRSALPEVAGDAAILVDPESVDDIAAGLERVLCDEDLRVRLASAGPIQAARFSWSRCAELTVQAYRRALA